MIKSRRALIAQAGALGAVVSTGAWAQEPVDFGTPSMNIGPFYPVVKPADRDADLTRQRGRSGRAQGQLLHLTGRVTDLQGRPVRNAVVEIWQANAAGRYDHPADQSPVPLDPNFHGYGAMRTDAEGRYTFVTVRPAPYSVAGAFIRAAHIHFDISGQGSRLITQMYFPGDPHFGADPVFQGDTRMFLDSSKAPVFGALSNDAPGLEAGAQLCTWDIRLIAG